MGTTGGIALEAVGSSAHWIAYCQSEDKDVTIDARGFPQTSTSLWLQLNQDAESIDALLKNSENGRFVVIYAKDEPWLVDAVARQRVSLSDLHIDLRADAWSDHRSFAFSPDGKFLLVLTRRDGQAGAALIDVKKALSTRDPSSYARQVEHDGGTPWRVSAEGSHFVLRKVAGATSEAWPVPESDLPRRCAGGIQRFEAHGAAAAPVPKIDVSTGLLSIGELGQEKIPIAADSPPLHPQPAPDYLMSFRDGWIRRNDKGRLLFVHDKLQRQVASSRCGARVIHADERSGYFLIACEEYRPTPASSKRKKQGRSKPKYRFDLYLVRPGDVVDLDANLMRTGVDMMPQQGPRFFPLRPGATAALVDFEKKKLIEMDEGTTVMAAHDEGAILRSGRHLSFFDGKSERPLEEKFVPLSPIVPGENGVVIGRHHFVWSDLAAEKPATEIPGPPVALTPDGHVLMVQEPATSERWARGPLILLPRPHDATAASGEQEAAKAPLPPEPTKEPEESKEP